jgi:hypothetical protein
MEKDKLLERFERTEGYLKKRLNEVNECMLVKD